MAKRSVVLGVAIALFAGGLLLPRSAWAVPAFARAYNVNCATCHSAWPMLNATGRTFKENGYQFVRGEPEKFETIGDLKIPMTFPWAIVTKFRPYDHQEGGPTKLRSLHEIELFVAGNAWDYGSYFAEFEMEDETGFEFEVAHASGGFHPFQWGNLLLGYTPVFHCDPYNTLSNARKLTRSNRQALVQGESTGVAISSTSQNVEACGRDPWINKVFYEVAYSADVDGDFEGEGPKDVSGRLVFDILPLDAVPEVDLSVGAFVINGRQDQQNGVTRSLDFMRYGVDLQAEYLGANLLFAFVRAEDDLLAGGSEHNNLWYVEGFYAFDRDFLKSVGLPGAAIVPIFRVDQFEENDGVDSFTDLTLNLSYYAWDNVRVYVEYAKRLDAPSGDPDPWRWTVQVEVAF